MKKLLGILVLGLLWCNVNETALAGDCDAIISGERETALTCADNDTLTVSGSITFDGQNAVDAQTTDGVTITNTGTIQSTGASAIRGQSSLTLNITNSDTIYSEGDYGIKLIEAEKITITNEANATIKTDPSDSSDQFAIGGINMGNCSTCVNDSTTSSGEGLTLHNYGNIDSHSRTVYGGHESSHTSKKTKIYNYDGGMIDTTTSATFKFQYAEDFELYNYSGATIQAGSKYAIEAKEASNVTIDNAGTISAVTTDTIYCVSCSDVTLTNSGNITSGGTNAVRLDSVSGTNTITNSGTISAGLSRAIRITSATGVTITNEAGGTISSTGLIAIGADNAFSPTIKNSGTTA